MQLRFNPIKISHQENKVTGLAVPYNTISNPLMEKGQLFRETILPHAFSESLSKDIHAYLNHQAYLGRSSTGALRLSDKEDGIYFEFNVSDATAAERDLLTYLSRGDIQGMSFGFLPTKRKKYSRNKELFVEVQRGTLLEVSFVFDAAYSQTYIERANQQPQELAPYRSLELLKLRLDLMKRERL